MCLSDEVTYESCANPHPHDQNINQANLLERNGLNILRLNSSGASPKASRLAERPEGDWHVFKISVGSASWCAQHPCYWTCPFAICTFFKEHRQTTPRKVRFANFRGRTAQLVPKPPSACKCYTLKRGCQNEFRTPSPKVREPHFPRFGLLELLNYYYWFVPCLKMVSCVLPP